MVGSCVLAISLMLAVTAFAGGEVSIVGTLSEDGKRFLGDDGQDYSLIIDQNIERPLMFLKGKKIELTGVAYDRRGHKMFTVYYFKELDVKITGIVDMDGERVMCDDGAEYWLRLDEKIATPAAQLAGKRVELAGAITEDSVGHKIMLADECKLLE